MSWEKSYLQMIQATFFLMLWVVFSLLIYHYHTPWYVTMWLPWAVILGMVNTLFSKSIAEKFPFLKSTRLQYAIPIVLGVYFLFALSISLMYPFPATDPALTIRCAGQNMLHLQNPYQQAEPQCYHQLGVSSIKVGATPLHEGIFKSASNYPSNKQISAAFRKDIATYSSNGFANFGYPPIAILTELPVVNTNWQIIMYYLVAVALALSFLCCGTWKKDKLPILVYLWGVLALFFWYYHGDPEIIGYLLLAVSFARLKDRRLSAVSMALAILINQVAWFFVPIYLMTGWNKGHFKERALWFIGSSLVFLLPWLIWKPSILVSLWKFLLIPFYPIGVGLGVKLANMVPHFVLFGLMLVYLAMIVVWVWRRPRWGAVGVLLTINVFWFSPRAEVNYYFVMFLLVAALWLANGYLLEDREGIRLASDFKTR